MKLVWIYTLLFIGVFHYNFIMYYIITIGKIIKCNALQTR